MIVSVSLTAHFVLVSGLRPGLAQSFLRCDRGHQALSFLAFAVSLSACRTPATAALALRSPVFLCGMPGEGEEHIIERRAPQGAARA